MTNSSPTWLALALLSFGCPGCGSESSVQAPSPGDPLPALEAVPDPVLGGRIVDAQGREVLLRGVNVNAFVEYWQYDDELFTTYPFTDEDADAIAFMGWNAVRLLVSWSRIEPQPGAYDDAYLDEVASAIAMLRERGIYTILDLHQDAWGPSLAAPPDEVCDDRALPAGGWDGAPEWATFDDDQPRCVDGQRETVPAVLAAWTAFFDNMQGPGGVGIQTRYVEMFAYLVARFATDDAVAGYDVMNEPGALNPAQQPKLARFYSDALAAMRAAEDAAGAPRRLFLFEPSGAWVFGFAAPPPFEQDDQVVYSPHIYQEGITNGALEDGFARARSEASELFEGAPVVTGEWGSDPGRAADPQDDFFERHARAQDTYRFGAMIWTWREACGDPHKYGDVRAGRVPEVWGFFEVDCATNTTSGPRTALTDALRKLSLRFAPGPIVAIEWTLDDRSLDAQGDTAANGNRLELFVPDETLSAVEIDSTGLTDLGSTPWFGGTLLFGRAAGGSWLIRVIR